MVAITAKGTPVSCSPCQN